MSDLTLTQRDDAPQDDVRFVYESLIAHNRVHAPGPEWSHLRFFLRDGEGSIRGGLLGEIYFGWLYVSILWVDEAHRGKGWGKRMLAAAEEQAVARGCHAAWLDTFSFQAPEYYQPLGYEVFGTLEDYPLGRTRYYLRKRLTAQ